MKINEKFNQKPLNIGLSKEMVHKVKWWQNSMVTSNPIPTPPLDVFLILVHL